MVLLKSGVQMGKRIGMGQADGRHQESAVPPLFVVNSLSAQLAAANLQHRDVMTDSRPHTHQGSLLA